jgi:uncharacterized protein (DUF305 family)
MAAAALTLGCAGSGSVQVISPSGPVRSPTTSPAASFTQADVDFVSGMIAHHAQAVLIAGWAPGHDAGSAVRTLCERIVVAQRDEIAFMQDWLRQRNQPVPAGDPHSAHHTTMPGMLTAQQLERLNAARGDEFDRLFLGYMIQHHEGAITMVDRLFGSYGAAQDDVIYKLASDIYAHQTTEIERMDRMLAAMSSDSPQ